MPLDPAENPAGPGRKRRILVVDDDAILLELAGDILGDEFEVLKAVDGQDGWEKAQAFLPDLVISDLMMPRMHGYELCELLKGPKGVPGVRVLIASSKPFSTDKAQAEASGADAYLVKPYTPSAFIEKVRALLSAGAPEAARPPQPPPPRRRRAAPCLSTCASGARAAPARRPARPPPATAAIPPAPRCASGTCR